MGVNSFTRKFSMQTRVASPNTMTPVFVVGMNLRENMDYSHPFYDEIFRSPELAPLRHVSKRDSLKSLESERGIIGHIISNNRISFSAPETDFTGHYGREGMVTLSAAPQEPFKTNLSFAAPESDFSAYVDGLNVEGWESVLLDEHTQHLNFSSPESDFTANYLGEANSNSEVLNYDTKISYSTPFADIFATQL